MDIRRLFGSSFQPQDPALEEQQQAQTKSPPTEQNVIGLTQNDALEIFDRPISSGLLQVPDVSPETDLPNLNLMPSFGTGGTDTDALQQSDCTLAMILAYLGKNVTPEQVALAIGRGPENFDDMIEFARRQGLEAEGYNNGTVEELKSFIDKGIPVMAGISSATSVGNDMITITGYGVDNQKDPPQEYIVYRDGVDGTEQRMSMAEFQRRWADGGPPQGFDSGYHNYFMAFAPDGTDLPAGRDEGIEATSSLNRGISDMQAGWDRLFGGDSTIGDRVHGPFQLAGSLFETVGGFGSFLSRPGQWLNDKVEGIPVLENILQPFGDIFDTAGSVIADLFGGVGEAFDDLGNAFGCLADGDFSGFGEGLLDVGKDIGGAVVDTVVDTVEGVVDAVGDFFSGW